MKITAGLAIPLAVAMVWTQGTAAQTTVSSYRDRLKGFDPGQPVSADMVAIVVEGLNSSDESVRWSALEMVAGIVSPYRGLMLKLSPKAFETDVARLWPHEARVRSLLDDSSPRVRSKAVEAAALLQYSRAPLPAPVTATVLNNFDCGLDLAQRFERIYDADADASVRSNIVRMLTAVSDTVAEPTRAIVHGVLMRALNDSSWGVVNYALRDVVRRRLPGSLAESVRLLRHKDFQVRMVAAQMVASFGADARPHLDELRRAAEAETDDITRRTLLGSISVIEKSR